MVDLGFKIGVTGQVTNPNAKKLRNTITELVKTVGLESLVIETDCPDMMPLSCQTNDNTLDSRRNVPANLPIVLQGLADLLQIDVDSLSKMLWKNSTRLFDF